MRRYWRNRIGRRTVWLIFAIAVALAIPATVSLFKPFGQQHRMYRWRFCDGSFQQMSWRTPFGKFLAKHSYNTGWWFQLPTNRRWGFGWPDEQDYFHQFYRLPLYPPIIAMTLVGGTLIFTFPHHKRGHCQKCGYDLHGNESGRCPECGEDKAQSLP